MSTPLSSPRLVDEATYPRENLAALNSPVGDLFSIEKSRDWSEVRSGVHRLRRSIPPAEVPLRRAFVTWLRKVILPRLDDWLRGRGPQFASFFWQAGFGAFSVSQSQVKEVRTYIRNQREHHQVKSFQEEFRAFLNTYGIEYDERYVWD